MSKNVKKNKRRAALLRLRGMFLGIKGADTMAVKRLTHHLHAVTGHQKFSTYVTSCNRQDEWDEFKSEHESLNKSIKRYLREAESDIDVDRHNHQLRQYFPPRLQRDQHYVE